MSNEQLPDIDPSVHEEMELFALLLNLHSTTHDAEGIQDGQKAFFQQERRTKVKHDHYAMVEAFHPSTPVACTRIALTPERPSVVEFDVQRLYIRTPSEWDSRVPASTDHPWNDYFVQTIDSSGTSRHYFINGTTYVQYGAGDTFERNPAAVNDYDLYRITQAEAVVPELTPLDLNRLLASYASDSQTNEEL